MLIVLRQATFLAEPDEGALGAPIQADNREVWLAAFDNGERPTSMGLHEFGELLAQIGAVRMNGTVRGNKPDLASSTYRMSSDEHRRFE